MRRVRVNDALNLRACAQHFGMNEHLVVARHGAADLLAIEIDRDDVVDRHLVEPDGGGLHQKTAGLVRQPHGHVAGNEIALILAGENATRIGELSSERLGHSPSPSPRFVQAPSHVRFVLPCPANSTSLSKTPCEAGIATPMRSQASAAAIKGSVAALLACASWVVAAPHAFAQSRTL